MGWEMEGCRREVRWRNGEEGKCRDGEGSGVELRGGWGWGWLGDSVIHTLHVLYICRLYVFRKLKNLRILIGGGDGTFGWVLSALQDCQGNLACPNPPCALLPLGTGEWVMEYTHMHIHFCIRTYICTYVCVVCTYAHVYTCTYVCIMCLCVCVRTYRGQGRGGMNSYYI